MTDQPRPDNADYEWPSAPPAFALLPDPPRLHELPEPALLEAPALESFEVADDGTTIRNYSIAALAWLVALVLLVISPAVVAGAYRAAGL